MKKICYMSGMLSNECGLTKMLDAEKIDYVAVAYTFYDTMYINSSRLSCAEQNDLVHKIKIVCDKCKQAKQAAEHKACKTLKR